MEIFNDLVSCLFAPLLMAGLVALTFWLIRSATTFGGVTNKRDKQD